jgi:hypothetical protein
MENMMCTETDPSAERKMNEIFHRLQGTEENDSSIGICICLIVIFVGSLKIVIEDFYLISLKEIGYLCAIKIVL